MGERVGITSIEPLRGFKQYLAVSGKRRGASGEVVTFYHYRVPRKLVSKALKSGGSREEERKEESCE